MLLQTELEVLNIPVEVVVLEELKELLLEVAEAPLGTLEMEVMDLGQVVLPPQLEPAAEVVAAEKAHRVTAPAVAGAYGSWGKAPTGRRQMMNTGEVVVLEELPVEETAPIQITVNQVEPTVVAVVVPVGIHTLLEEPVELAR